MIDTKKPHSRHKIENAVLRGLAETNADDGPTLPVDGIRHDRASRRGYNHGSAAAGHIEVDTVADNHRACRTCRKTGGWFDNGSSYNHHIHHHTHNNWVDSHSYTDNSYSHQHRNTASRSRMDRSVHTPANNYPNSRTNRHIRRRGRGQYCLHQPKHRRREPVR